MDIRSDRQKGLSYVELGRKYHMDPRTAKRYAESPQKPEYNGPRNPDHSWKKDRERGRINKSKERGSEPWHEQCTARNLKQNWCWRY